MSLGSGRGALPRRCQTPSEPFIVHLDSRWPAHCWVCCRFASRHLSRLAVWVTATKSYLSDESDEFDQSDSVTQPCTRGVGWTILLAGPGQNYIVHIAQEKRKPEENIQERQTKALSGDILQCKTVTHQPNSCSAIVNWVVGGCGAKNIQKRARLKCIKIKLQKIEE